MIAKYLDAQVIALRDLSKKEVLKFYLDTSVPNALFLTEDELKIDKNLVKYMATQEFWVGIRDKRYAAIVSDLYFREINKATESKQRSLERIVDGLDILRLSADVEKLSEIYIQEKIIRKKKPEDARHIAIASLHAVHALVTWNFKDMLKIRKIEKLRKINKDQKLYDIPIITPIEVLRIYKNE